MGGLFGADGDRSGRVPEEALGVSSALREGREPGQQYHRPAEKARVLRRIHRRRSVTNESQSEKAFY